MLSKKNCNLFYRLASLTLLALPGPLLPAQVHLTTHNLVVEAGKTFEVIASSEDQEVPDFNWSVEINGQPAPEIQERAPSSWFKASGNTVRYKSDYRDTGVLRFRATDPAHWNPAGNRPFDEISILFVPSMLTLTRPVKEDLLAGATCLVELARADNRDPVDQGGTWSVLERNGGTVEELDNGHVQYTAPMVKRPSTFHVGAWSGDEHKAMLAIRVHPSITLTAARQDVVAGNQVQLTAHRKDGTPATIGFRVAQRPGQEPLGEVTGAGLYTTPDVQAPATFTLEAFDLDRPEDCAEVPIHVLPRSMPNFGATPYQNYDLLFQTILPGVMGTRAMTHVPTATLLAGQLDRPMTHTAPSFNRISSLLFVEADPAMGALSRQWLVADATSIRSLSAQNRFPEDPADAAQAESTALLNLAEAGVRISALAVRPAGSSPENPYRVVYATEQVANTTGRLYEMKPDGTSRPLAGSHDPVDPDDWGNDGPAAEATFEPIHGLAVAADGTVYLAEEHRVRVLSPAGTVRTLVDSLSIFRWMDDEEEGADSQSEIDGLALDPVTGDLYIMDNRGIVKLAQDGATSVLIDRSENFDWILEDGFQTSDYANINRGRSLHLHGRNLFIPHSAQRAIRVFNLDTEEIYNLVGDPNQVGTRMGPIGHFAPERSAGDCAALEQPRAIAINAEGTCLVGLKFGIVQLTLPPGAFTPPALEQQAEQQAAAPAAASFTTSGSSSAFSPWATAKRAREQANDEEEEKETAPAAAASSSSSPAASAKRSRKDDGPKPQGGPWPREDRME